MRQASRVFTALAVLGLIWFFWPFGGDKDVVTIDKPPPTGHDGRLFTTPLREPPSPEKKKPTQAPSEAVAPAATQALKPKREPKLFYRVVVRDGGTLQAGDTLITLDGITAHDADAQCKDTKGQSWPCGTRARAALRRLIQGRAVRCNILTSGDQTPALASCTVRGTDLSLWMVSHGWAKPKDPAETKMTEAADTARKRKAGIWR